MTFARLRLADWVLATVALSRERRVRPRCRAPGATALAGFAAALTALLVLYRILQEPGFDELTPCNSGPRWRSACSA